MIRFFNLSPFSIYFIFSLLMTLVSLLLGFTHTRTYIWEISYHQVLMMFFFLSGIPLVKGSNKNFEIKKEDLIIGTILFLLALLIRTYHINDPLWLDEFVQMDCLLEPLEINFIDCSSWQQQPPNDYYLSALGVFIFGASSFGARFFSYLLGSFLAFLIYSICRRFSGRITSIASSLIIIFNPVLISYSNQARPISHTVFLAALLIYFLQEASHHKSNIWYRISLVGILLLFLLSAGFQPAITIFTLCVISLLVLIFKPKYRKEALLFITSSVISVSLFIPFLLNILKFSESNVQNASSKLFSMASI